MKKLLRLKLEQIFEASGGLALNMQSYSGPSLLAEASLPLGEVVISRNEMALVEDKLNGFLAKQELDESLWLNIQEFIKNEQNEKYLPRPLGLLLEIISLRTMATSSNRN